CLLTRMIIYLIPLSRDVRSRSCGTEMRRYPRINGPAALPLFVLHRMGFFMPRELLRERRALTSPFHPCLYLCCQRTGGVFSVTLSVAAILQLRRPRILRGMSAYAVRTFLQQAKRLTSDHLPSASTLAQDRKAGSHESKRNQDRRKKG